MCFSIETEHLILRKFNEKDGNDFYKITRDYDIIDYLPYVFTSTPKETFKLLKAYIRNCNLVTDFYLAIEEKSSNNLIGALIITKGPYLNDFEVAYFISNTHRRQGYMLEALNGFINSNLLKNKTLSFQIYKDNYASLSVINHLEGIVNNSFLLKEEANDFFLFHYHID